MSNGVASSIGDDDSKQPNSGLTTILTSNAMLLAMQINYTTSHTS